MWCNAEMLQTPPQKPALGMRTTSSCLGILQYNTVQHKQSFYHYVFFKLVLTSEDAAMSLEFSLSPFAVSDPYQLSWQVALPQLGEGNIALCRLLPAQNVKTQSDLLKPIGHMHFNGQSCSMEIATRFQCVGTN
jgi:hypothetical protein